MDILLKHEAISPAELCKSQNWQTLEETMAWLSNIFTNESIHIFKIENWYGKIRIIKVPDKRDFLEHNGINANVGYDIGMMLDTEYICECNSQEKTLSYICEDVFFSSIRFSKEEIYTQIRDLETIHISDGDCKILLKNTTQSMEGKDATPLGYTYEELSFDAKKTLDACLLINKADGHVEELARRHGGKITQGKWLEEVKNNMRQGGERVNSVAVDFFKTNIPEKLKKGRGKPRKQQA